MSAIGLPFNPLRDRLYSRQELFEGLAKNDPKSYSRCADIEILSYFAKYGKRLSWGHALGRRDGIPAR